MIRRGADYRNIVKLKTNRDLNYDPASYIKNKFKSLTTASFLVRFFFASGSLSALV